SMFLVGELLARLDVKLVVNEQTPVRLASRLNHRFDLKCRVLRLVPPKQLLHISLRRQCGIGQRPVVTRIAEGKRQDAPARELAAQLCYQLEHFISVRVRENRKGHDDVELQPEIRNRKVANPAWVVL